MSLAELDGFPTMVEAPQSVLEGAVPGDTVVVCRGSNHSCPGGCHACRWCACIPWHPGLTVEDVLLEAQPQA